MCPRPTRCDYGVILIIYCYGIRFYSSNEPSKGGLESAKLIREIEDVDRVISHRLVRDNLSFVRLHKLFGFCKGFGHPHLPVASVQMLAQVPRVRGDVHQRHKARVHGTEMVH